MAEFRLTDENINELQVDSLRKLIERCKHAHYTDVHVRINGKWEKFEADWIKHMKETKIRAMENEMGYEKLLNYLERKTADTHELQAASAIIGLRQRVQELEKEAKQLRDLQYELMRSGALVAIEKCKNATGQRRVIDMYVSANQIAEDLLNAMDSGA